ncbi:MAG: type II toxin-antitoxin system Phd/YefM family antitoxin [Candidatus Latescibacteria bacterium]|nr:type II toxin-antitoxin system Phd/YefM family antitoxin [Candidatus Latescibacterota bacterium]
MRITSVTSREFNRDVSKAKRITDRGRVAHVLLTIEDYLKITGKEESIVELLAMPEAADIDFEPPRLHCAMYRAADLS